MAYTVIDPETFSSKAVFSESEFLENAGGHDWEKYRNKSILIRGCSSRVVPPWAFMYLTGKLVGRAKVIRFGNEHDNIVVYRVPSVDRPTIEDRHSA